MRERYGGRLRNHVPAKQAQLHPRLTLRHTVAHGRYTPGYLSSTADGIQGVFDLLRIAGIGGMSRKHVVVGRDDANVGAIHHFDNGLICTPAGCDAVSQIAAT